MTRSQRGLRVTGVLLVAVLGTLAPIARAAAASGWATSLVPFSASGPAGGALGGVACMTTVKCVAVGSYNTNRNSAYAEPLVEVTSGSTWTGQALHADGFLQSVSCPTTTWCLAVGTSLTAARALISTYTAGHWTTATPRMSVSPDSVSCASQDRCVATGLNAAGHAVVEAWNGTTWSATVLPGVGAPRLVGEEVSVSCATTTWCAVVGGDLAYVGVRGVWTSSKLSLRANAVSCWRVQGCLAVGDTASWTFAAGHWNESKLPQPGPTSGETSAVGGVTCRSSTQCLASATYYQDCGHCSSSTAIVLSLHGTTWTARGLPVPRGDLGGAASDVTCTSPDACVVVGGAGFVSPANLVNNAFDVSVAAIDTFNGHGWRPPALAAVSGPAAASLEGVSCESADSCVAAGGYENAVGELLPFVAADDAGRWIAKPLALPTGDTGAQLTAVSCVSTTCVAVGWQSTATTATPLVEELGQSGWTDVAVPVPSGGGDYWLNAVSCASVDACVAVGDLGGLILSLAGGTWSVMLAPGAPANESLTGVDCTSTNACIAVGDGAFVETLSGGTWQPSTVPDATPGGLDLAGIGCADATDCLAAGSVNNAGGLHPAVASGPAPWTVSMPGPTSARYRGAACIASTTCLAVGYEGTIEVSDATVVTVASGVASVMILPPPAGAVQNWLKAISCGAPTACVAVGEGIGLAGDDPEVSVNDGLTP